MAPSKNIENIPGGNEDPPEDTAKFYESNLGMVISVGIFPENCSSEGVVDLAGNIWEWCWDLYDREYYRVCAEQSLIKDPQGPKEGHERVVRGGAFYYLRAFLRCADRNLLDPGQRLNFLGFRVVRVHH